MPHNESMPILPNQEDRGIETDLNSPARLDQDGDGFVEDGLGDPAAPEDDAGE
jgi:hypothetical protein